MVRRVDQQALTRIEQTFPAPGWTADRRKEYLRTFSEMNPELVEDAVNATLAKWTKDMAPPPGSFLELYWSIRSAKRTRGTNEPTFIQLGPKHLNAWVVIQPGGRRIDASTYNQRGVPIQRVAELEG
jgi:hypothetical protein